MTDPAERLDETIRRHYEQQRLPNDRVERILVGARHTSRRRWRPAWMSGVAASIVITMGSLHLWQTDNIRQSVLAEVAMNHRKNLAAEVQGSTYAAITLGLRDVNFPLEPTTTSIPGARLTGARYCSIQGELAVLLKLEVGGRRHTLYVTPMAGGLVRIVPYEASLDEVDIRLWSDEGRFFALAVDGATETRSY